VSWGVGAAGCGSSLTGDTLKEANLAKARSLNQIAGRRGQTLAQMALAWTLRDPR
jgi:L-glyceraldehyde 3-phosphate reductase